MAFDYLAPMIATGDMRRSVQFYVEVLGFTRGMETADFSRVHRDNVHILLTAPGTHRAWHGAAFTGQLYIYLDEGAAVDALWREIGGRAEAIYEPEDFWYGMREFAVRDPDGYQLSFGARIDNPPENPC